jgi:hypothetical protein
MIACYILSLVTFLMFLTGLVQSFLNFSIGQAHHVVFMILTCIIYSLTETLVIFFFVGTGVSVKEYTRDHKIDGRYHQRSIAIKRRVYPPLMLNILAMVILFVLAGAYETHRIPVWLYQMIFIGCLAHYLKVKIIQNDCFRDNTQIILEMSGVNRGT